MMTTTQRTLAKGFWPVLLLSAVLSLPAASVASSAPNAKAHAADKANRNDHKNKGHQKQAKQAVKQEKKAQHQLQKQLQQQEKVQRQQARIQQTQQRLAAQQRVQAGRQAELTRQATVQRQLRLQREAELQRRIVRAPAFVAPRSVRNRPWYGWQTRRGYSRFGSGAFQLDGTFIGQQHGCALVQDHNGQVIPLLGNPGDLRRGEHLLLSGRIQSSSVCGTAFRVSSVDRIWTDASHRRLVFDRRSDGDYSSERYDDRYNRDRVDRYDDRYDDDYYDDRYDDDRYDRSDNRRLISVEGELDRNLVCTSLRADDGERYGLSGDLRDFRDGDFVRVVGFLEGRSVCGGRSIEVQEIHG